eukprot:COSAG06_NODE_1906_length_8092_cov_8.987864_8_plen_92_part_00
MTRTSRGDEHEMKSHVKSHAGKGRGKYNKLFIADRDACRCRRGWEKNRRRAGRTGAELLNAVRVICLICNLNYSGVNLQQRPGAGKVIRRY